FGSPGSAATAGPDWVAPGDCALAGDPDTWGAGDGEAAASAVSPKPTTRTGTTKASAAESLAGLRSMLANPIISTHPATTRATRGGGPRGEALAGILGRRVGL